MLMFFVLLINIHFLCNKCSVSSSNLVDQLFKYMYLSSTFCHSNDALGFALFWQLRRHKEEICRSFTTYSSSSEEGIYRTDARLIELTSSLFTCPGFMLATVSVTVV